jgi:hypothetical protein
MDRHGGRVAQVGVSSVALDLIDPADSDSTQGASVWLRRRPKAFSELGFGRLRSFRRYQIADHLKGCGAGPPGLTVAARGDGQNLDSTPHFIARDSKGAVLVETHGRDGGLRGDARRSIEVRRRSSNPSQLQLGCP